MLSFLCVLRAFAFQIHAAAVSIEPDLRGYPWLALFDGVRHDGAEFVGEQILTHGVGDQAMTQG